MGIFHINMATFDGGGVGSAYPYLGQGQTFDYLSIKLSLKTFDNSSIKLSLKTFDNIFA